MAVVLQMEPKTPPLSFAKFCETAPPFSIALDGYVAEGPSYSNAGPHLNLNHHEGVSRLDTHATCGQAAIHIRLGLFERFSDSSGPRAIVYANDCDQDVAVSWALLHNPHLVVNPMFPLLNRLIDVADKLDATAGAYPYPKTLPFLRGLAWIFQPYRQCRLSGELDQREASAYVRVITDIEHRILNHISGKGQEIDLDLNYEVIGGGQGWVMVREHGADARTAMFGDGIRAFVAVRDRGNGRYTYSYGRMSPYINFPLPRIYDAANVAEGILPYDPNRHGGADTIGGSPRITGSGLTPREMESLISAVMRQP